MLNVKIIPRLVNESVLCMCTQIISVGTYYFNNPIYLCGSN